MERSFAYQIGRNLPEQPDHAQYDDGSRNRRGQRLPAREQQHRQHGDEDDLGRAEELLNDTLNLREV